MRLCLPGRYLYVLRNKTSNIVMGNPCKVIITRGKNKGNICGEINTKCKHVSEPLVCSVCKTEFDRTTSYYRHVNSRHNGRAKPINKIKIAVSTKDESLPIQVQVQVQVRESKLHRVFDRLAQLEKQNIELREEVEELKLKPTTTNYIAILGNDFYSELINKIGRPEAMRFLAEKGTKSPLSVFEKLYLEDRSPDDYPIACRDKYHFRYLDDQKRMVDDRGGSNIGTVVSKQLTDAVEHAVHDFEIEGHGNSVYGLENVQRLRQRLAELDQDSVIKELAYITNNPNHPFFRDED
jgi:uncharacterized C2H2 Zn-finger protein